MKRTILIMALMLTTLAVDAQSVETEKTLYIVDGVVTAKEDVDALKPEQIRNMNVVSGIDRAVVVTTVKDSVVATICERGDTVVIRGKPKKKTMVVTVDKRGEGSVVIDEKLNGTMMRVITIPDSKHNQGYDALIVIKRADGTIEVAQDYGQFDPNDIKAISVLKDEESLAQFSTYGDTSKGVILIELK